MTEAYGTDAVSLLGYLAAVTERVTLAAQILPIFSRTPALLAMAAAGLDDVSDGRFILGLGASGPQVVEGWHGVPYDAPLQRTREVIEICRAVWRRERLIHDGPRYRIPLPPDQGTGLGKPLKLIHHPVRERIPVFLAALGERNVELTAELADGWIPFLYIPELAGRVWGDALERGGRRRGSEFGPLEISAGGPFAVTAPGPLRARGRDRIALYVGGMGAAGTNYYHRVAVRYGFRAEADAIQRSYLAGDTAAAAAAVPAGLLEGTSLIGDRHYLRDRLHAYAAAGVTVLQVDPVGEDPVRDLARLRELIDEISPGPAEVNP